MLKCLWSKVFIKNSYILTLNSETLQKDPPGTLN